MAEESNQERTEAPTERRREELRREGQFAYSREIPAALILGATLLALYFFGKFLLNVFTSMLTRTFSNLYWGEFSTGTAASVFRFIGADPFQWFGLLLTVFFFVGLLGGIGQIGFNISLKPLSPDFLKINPINGFGRIFSLNNLIESIKILLKTAVVCYLCYSILLTDLNALLQLSVEDKTSYLASLWQILQVLLFKFFLSFALIAALDYLWQRISFERRIRMSRQELREELRQSEGDPLIKARIRQIQQKMSRARMLQEVPKADLVLTNPTHYAVVLKYEPGVMLAPQVVAKGLDYLALRIIEIAQTSGVVVTRQPALARDLYKNLEIGSSVPEEFYALVAEVLAAAYKSKGKKLGPA